AHTAPDTTGYHLAPPAPAATRRIPPPSRKVTAAVLTAALLCFTTATWALTRL
ncbi:serine/threonine protein kinase, partial [Streptomyces polychromogenes]|nr:serine/threonine protein kinase [Streptomyces polychromogenes]